MRAFGPAGPPIIGELELASRFLQGQIVAITGSNGKTTTTSLLGKIFADAGGPTLVGGNIGTPVIDLVAQSTPQTVSVLEVSSFQLETVEEFRPHIAVVLNITPDHLDRHGTFENYAAMKARITAQQTAEDFFVLNAEDKPTQMLAAKTKAQVFWFSGRRAIKQGAFVHGESMVFLPREGARPEPVMPLAEIPLKGAHNVENVLAAVCAARLGGVSAESIRASVASFKAVEHRLEFVATVRGVAFYNDSKATNVDATKKALEAFPGGVHLILGGKDKNSDYTELADLLRARVKVVYTIGSAAEKIERHLAGVVKIVSAGTLDCGRAPGRAACSRRRCRPACACLLELRPVRQLRAARARLQGDGAGLSRAGLSLKQGSGRDGKARRRRQMAVRHRAAAGALRAGDGLLRLGRDVAGGVGLALQVRRQAGNVGALRHGCALRVDARGLPPL